MASYIDFQFLKKPLSIQTFECIGNRVKAILFKSYSNWLPYFDLVQHCSFKPSNKLTTSLDFSQSEFSISCFSEIHCTFFDFVFQNFINFFLK